MWVAGLLGVLTILLAVTLIHREPSLDWDRAHYLTAPVTVTVTGAVAHPGEYIFSAGSTIKDLLQQAEPLPKANLKKLSKRKKLVSHQVIEIKSHK